MLFYQGDIVTDLSQADSDYAVLIYNQDEARLYRKIRDEYKPVRTQYVMYDPNRNLVAVEVRDGRVFSMDQLQPKQVDDHIELPMNDSFNYMFDYVAPYQAKNPPVINNGAIARITNNLSSPVILSYEQNRIQFPDGLLTPIPGKRLLPGTKITFQLSTGNQISQVIGRLGLNRNIVYVSSVTVPATTYSIKPRQEIMVYSV